jgi:ribosomal protein S12
VKIEIASIQSHSEVIVNELRFGDIKSHLISGQPAFVSVIGVEDD